MMFLDQSLKILCSSQGMNLAQLADKLGVSKTAVYAWEKGISLPSVKTLGDLKLLYPALNLNWMLFGDGPMFLSASEVDEELKRVQSELMATRAALDDIKSILGKSEVLPRQASAA